MSLNKFFGVDILICSSKLKKKFESPKIVILLKFNKLLK